MRKFMTECKDTKTGLSMVLSECSYNQACDWLSKELAKHHSEIWRTEQRIDGLMVIFTAVAICPVDSAGTMFMKDGRTFYYDEERGYLLGE